MKFASWIQSQASEILKPGNPFFNKRSIVSLSNECLLLSASAAALPTDNPYPTFSDSLAIQPLACLINSEES